MLDSFLIIITLLFVVRHRYYWHTRNNVMFRNNNPAMIAHRGSKVHAPENTIAAFMDAINYGFKYIEMDVCQLKDRTLVCSHNFDLEQETNGQGWIYDKNYCDLKLIRTGVRSHSNNVQPIPKLIDALNKIPDNIVLNIEIKSRSIFDLSTANSIGKMSRDGLINHKFIVSCFNPFVVAYLKLFYPKIYVGYIIEEIRMRIFTHWIHPDFIHIDAGLADDAMFDECEIHGLGINLWTLNSIPAMYWCLKRNVLGVITDNHELVKF